jgi:hypothetical protein
MYFLLANKTIYRNLAKLRLFRIFPFFNIELVIQNFLYFATLQNFPKIYLFVENIFISKI